MWGAETATNVGRYLQGEQFRHSIADIVEADRDLRKLLMGATPRFGLVEGPFTKLSDLLPADKWTIHHDTEVFTLPNLYKDKPLYSQQSVDVPVAGIYALQKHVVDNSRQAPIRAKIHNTGLRFGRAVAAEMMRARTRVRPADEDIDMLAAVDPAIASVIGVMASGYMSAVALIAGNANCVDKLDNHRGIMKNRLLMAPRVSHAALFSGLDDSDREMLTRNHSGVKKLFAKFFSADYPHFAVNGFMQFKLAAAGGAQFTIGHVADHVINPPPDTFLRPESFVVSMAAGGDALNQRDDYMQPTAAFELRLNGLPDESLQPEQPYYLLSDEEMLDRDLKTLTEVTDTIDRIAHTAHQLDLDDFAVEEIVTRLKKIAITPVDERDGLIEDLKGGIGRYVGVYPYEYHDLVRMFGPVSKRLGVDNLVPRPEVRRRSVPHRRYGAPDSDSNEGSGSNSEDFEERPPRDRSSDNDSEHDDDDLFTDEQIGLMDTDDELAIPDPPREPGGRLIAASRLWQEGGSPGGAAPSFPMSEKALGDLVDEMPTVEAMAPGACVALAEELVGKLYHVRMRASADDVVVGLSGVAGAQGRVVAGPGWNRVHDLDGVLEVVSAMPGSTAVIMTSRSDTKAGHVLALHSLDRTHTADTAATQPHIQDLNPNQNRHSHVRWVDPQRDPGDRVMPLTAEHGPWPKYLDRVVAAWAVIINPEGQVLDPDRWSRAITTSEALLDPPRTHQFAGAAEEEEKHRYLLFTKDGTPLRSRTKLVTSADGIFKLTVDKANFWVDADGKLYDSEQSVDSAGGASRRELFPIAESVVAPARSLLGERWPISLAEQEARRDDVDARIFRSAHADTLTGPRSDLADLFPSPEYQVHRDDISIAGFPGLREDAFLMMHYNHDVAVPGLYSYMAHVAANSRPVEPALISARRGLQFGRDVAAVIVQAWTKVRPLDEDMQMLVAVEPLVAVMGVMALAYPQIVGAIADGASEKLDQWELIPKNRMLLVPRVSHRTLWNALDADIRSVLTGNVAAINDVFTHNFRADYPNFAKGADLMGVEIAGNVALPSVGLTIGDLVKALVDMSPGESVLEPDGIRVSAALGGDRLNQRDGGRLDTVPTEARFYGSPKPWTPSAPKPNSQMSDEIMAKRDRQKVLTVTRDIDRIAHETHLLYKDNLEREVVKKLIDIAVTEGERKALIADLTAKIGEYVRAYPDRYHDLNDVLAPARRRLGDNLVPRPGSPAAGRPQIPGVGTGGRPQSGMVGVRDDSGGGGAAMVSVHQQRGPVAVARRGPDRLPRSSTTNIEDIKGWLRDGNRGAGPLHAGGRKGNGGLSAVDMYTRLSCRRPASRTAGFGDHDGVSRKELTELTGFPEITASPADIELVLATHGPGAHAIISVTLKSDRARRPRRRTFNAIYDGEKVHALDGQRGLIQEWPPSFDGWRITEWCVYAPADLMPNQTTAAPPQLPEIASSSAGFDDLLAQFEHRLGGDDQRPENTRS